MLNGIDRTRFGGISKKEEDKKKSIFGQKSFIKGILDKDEDKYGKLPYNPKEFDPDQKEEI